MELSSMRSRRQDTPDILKMKTTSTPTCEKAGVFIPPHPNRISVEHKRLGNRGSSIAMVWIYVLEMIFSVGFIYIILDQLVRVYLKDLAIQMGVDATLLTVFISVWTLLPFMWIGGALLYGITYTLKVSGEGG